VNPWGLLIIAIGVILLIAGFRAYGATGKGGGGAVQAGLTPLPSALSGKAGQPLKAALTPLPSAIKIFGGHF
jgi:hypothetical protein